MEYSWLIWQVDYEDLGGEALVQIWDVRGPQFIQTDWKPGDRFRAEIRGVDLAKRNTLEKMLFNVGLFTHEGASLLARAMEGSCAAHGVKKGGC